MRLANFGFLRKVLVGIKRVIYVKFFGVDLSKTCQFSLSAKFDLTNPRGVHVGDYSYVAFDASILTHDMTRGVRKHTRIGNNCFIGAKSIILPGVVIGDSSIVGAGSVVTKNVPPNSIVAGNPAKILKTNIQVNRYGRLLSADDIQRRDALENNLD